MSQLEFGDLKDTLRDEKERLLREREAGTHCLACGQFVKIYKRQIHSSIAVALIVLNRICLKRPGEYVHTVEVSKGHEACINGRTELPRAVVWGLIEPAPIDKSELENGSNTSGFWRITERGRAFVENKISIQKYAYTYNDTLLEFSEETTMIKDCLKKKFNYDELMNQ